MAYAQRKIKAKYLYNRVHDADSIIEMMIYLAAADEQRNRQEVTAPENIETANMVNLGIERLQQSVQQPPSGYTSTNRDDEGAMSATSDSKSLVETRYYKRGRKNDKKGRRNNVGMVLSLKDKRGGDLCSFLLELKSNITEDGIIQCLETYLKLF